MRSLTCIVCPIGCALTVEEGEKGVDGFPALTINGNRCPRGAVYAKEEIRAPKRVVTATCAIVEEADSITVGGGAESIAVHRGMYAPRRVPVKTVESCPREKINALLADIYKTRVKLPVKAGDTVIADWQGSGINVVAVRALE
ncbi:NAD(FAD)-dependent dehydrogenase [Spirochaetia bacterium]|nr:NAD(FAD)-dependent dehydrogenase [Spirochaetia bacterium]